MSRVCEMSGVGPLTGNKVSHSNRKTRTRWLPNLKKKKYVINELGRTVSLTLSTRSIRTIDKLGGLVPALLNMADRGFSEQVLKLKRDIQKKNRPAKTAKKTA